MKGTWLQYKYFTICWGVKLASGIGKEAGYGYILRIVSRNPNVKQETLKAIANDPKVEPRYTQCAKAALEHGKEAANHQI